MQSVQSTFTAETNDFVRKIAHSLNISWKRDSIASNRTFAIGISLIGGGDVIAMNPGAIGSPGNYRYFDESDYVQSLEWERGLSMPLGGISKALAAAKISNTSGRFTPRNMGGSGELWTSILPARPAMIHAGFNYNGIDNLLPQFMGIVDNQPAVNDRDKTVSLKMADYMRYFQNQYVDRSSIYTGVSTDTILESLMVQLGMSTAQYYLDPGINVIPFVLLEKGAKYSQIVQDLVEAENGYFYQDEQGRFRFENRQHWDSSPHNAVQRIIFTPQVIENGVPDDDHLVNVVEIKSKARSKAIAQKLWSLAEDLVIPAGAELEVFADFADGNGALPVLEVYKPTYSAVVATTSYYTITNSASVYLKNYTQFATSYKMTFVNQGTLNADLTALELWGRPAKVTSEIYIRKKRDASITAYDERPLIIENQFIQNQFWADSFAEVLLEDFANIENLQTITIRAIPELQLGDLISWQGRWWRIFDIKTTIDTFGGFIQELKLLQRTIRKYFRIGISTIGSADKIAP